MNRITIIIIEDHEMVREMWIDMFSEHAFIHVAGQAGNFTDGLKLISSHTPDVVLLDINLPDASGMDAVPLILQAVSTVKIIAVSMHNYPAYAKKMIAMGAFGYVTKNSSHREILAAVDLAMNGKQYICEEIQSLIKKDSA